MKRCATCKETKDKTEFRKDRSRNDGLYVSCKQCQQERNRPSNRKYQARLRTTKSSKKREYVVLKEQGLKRCKTCNEIKSLDEEFHSSGITRKPDCKKCHNLIWRERKLQRIRKVVEECGKEFKCEHCGWNNHPIGLDFHHTDPTKKDFTIASRWTISEENLKKEVEKCIILCCLCHRLYHAGLIKLGGLS